MRFLIVNHSYKQFLNWLYKTNPLLSQQTFVAQQAAYDATLFGSADFYRHALQSLGHEVSEFGYNNAHAQLAWQRERIESARTEEAIQHTAGHETADHATSWMDAQGRTAKAWAIDHVNQVQVWRKALGASPLGRIKPLLRPVLDMIDRTGGSLFRILIEQVKAIRPDVLFNQSVFAFGDDQLRSLKAHVGLLVGEHAATSLPPSIDYRLYDLIVSSFPPTVSWLRQRGVRAELNRLAFDPRVAEVVPAASRDVRVSFVGSLFEVHRTRLEMLSAVAETVPDIEVHGHVEIAIPPTSRLKGRIRPPLWGRDMYSLLARSTATLNHHGDIAPHANNMRLYEATGMGCLLITDHKDDLEEMFEPEKEVVTYRNAEECVEKVRFYLAERNQFVREGIMAAGRHRTLRDHTYRARMQRLVELISAA
jgi:hypothetical protein